MRIAPRHCILCTVRQTALARPFSVASQLRLREGKEQDPNEVEKNKQEQFDDKEKRRELKSAGEEAVGADQEKVKDNKEHISDLQKQTANESQKKHPEGDS